MTRTDRKGDVPMHMHLQSTGHRPERAIAPGTNVHYPPPPPPRFFGLATEPRL